MCVLINFHPLHASLFSTIHTSLTSTSHLSFCVELHREKTCECVSAEQLIKDTCAREAMFLSRVSTVCFSETCERSLVAYCGIYRQLRILWFIQVILACFDSSCKSCWTYNEHWKLRSNTFETICMARNSL